MSTLHTDRHVQKQGRTKLPGFLLSVLVVSMLAVSVPVVHAQPVADPPGAGPTAAATTNLNTPLPDEPAYNPSSSAFQLVVCDGPRLPSTVTKPQGYRTCDFNALILLVQHLINIMIVVGVLAAILLFSFTGYLYISGTPSNITRAHSIFPKIFVGFIIMLSAWFIVYQILSWLGSNEGFKTLLGKAL